MFESLIVVGLGLIFFFVGIILTIKYEQELYLVVVVIGIIIFGVGLVLVNIEDYEIGKTQYKKILDEFNNLDCSGKGDMILSNYLAGNTTISTKLIPVFKSSGCKFDVSMEIVLEQGNQNGQ